MQEEDQASAAASAETRTAAQAYEQYVTRSPASMDQVSMQLKQSWEQSRGTLQLSELVRDGMFLESTFACVAIVDSKGQLRTAIRPAACAQALAATDLLAYHRDNNTSALRIGGPPGPVGASHGAIVLTRRLDTADGDYGGVALLAVHAGYLTSFYLPPSFGRAGLLAIATVGAEAGLRLEQARAGQSARASLFPPDGRRWDTLFGTSLVDGPGGFADGTARLLGWQRSSVYPVVALVAMERSHAMEGWLSFRRDAWRTAAIAGVALLLAGGSVTLLAWRRAARNKARAAVNAAYRTATEGGTDGFFMAMPVRRRDGAIADFKIVDCNERGARFHELARTDMIGKRLSEIDQGTPGARLFDAYCIAMDAGFYEDERAMPAARRAQGGWARRRIVRVGEGLAITLQDVGERRAHEAELQRLSNEDSLTALPNRQWLMRYLPGVLDQAVQQGEDAALLLINLDDFKFVNEGHGQQVGDLLLQAAAQRLRALVRPGDRVVRFGGDEFVVLLLSPVADSRTERVAARIVEAFRAPLPLAGSKVVVGVSIGVSTCPRDGVQAAELIRHASIALDAAKAEGKGQYRLYDAALARTVHTRVQLRQSLVEAIEQEQFILHYQPRVDAHTGELRSMEALLRWCHPQRGMVAPLEFIALAESSGLIVQIGEMVMHLACRQIARWRNEGLQLVPVSVNVSPRQFAGGEVAAQLADALRAHAVPASLLEVEITESAMMGEQDDILAQLDAIRAFGVRLHLDDFGTGYSSLSQLQRLKMDVLKVDRAFTSELAVSREGKVFFQAIVSMAHALGMEVVAEGVETSDQLDILRELGCNEIQGYLIARPLPASEMAGMMRARFLFADAA